MRGRGQQVMQRSAISALTLVRGGTREGSQAREACGQFDEASAGEIHCVALSDRDPANLDSVGNSITTARS